MTTANTRVAQILLKRGNTAQSGSYVGPLGEVTLDTDLDTLRIHDGTTPGGFSILATKADVDQLNSDIGNISLGTIDTAPIIANVQIAVQSTINANVTAANAAIARLDANLGTVTANITSLLANAATQEGHITSLTASVATLSTSVSAMTANAASQETHINQINANVTAANAAITSLQGQVYTNSNAAAYLLGTITTGNIIPQSNVTYSLGNVDHQWRSLYLSSNTIFIGGQVLSVSEGDLLLNGNTISIDRLVNGSEEVVIDDAGSLVFRNNSFIQDSETFFVAAQSGFSVQTNKFGDEKNWEFEADGNLVLPQTGMNVSPAPTSWPGITYSDGTFQNTAFNLNAGNTAPASGLIWFNTEDGRTYVNPNGTWQDASPAVIPGNMVAYESNGNVELRDSASLVFPDTTVQSTAFDTHVGNTAPASGLIWYNTEDGRTYNKVNGQWVDANPAVLPGDLVTFNDSGNITLPAGGQVTWANGRSILHGITASGSADTGLITFAGVKIMGNGNGSQSGAINLVPNDYLYDAGQWVSIYPTNQFDYPHVHIAAGTGGELYIGNDQQYVKTAIDGSIEVSSYDGANTHQWIFGNNGTLTTNGTISIDGEGKGLIVDAGGDKRFGFMKYYGIEGALTHNSAVPIRIGRTVETDITQASAGSFTTEVYIAADGKVGIANVTPAHSLSVGGDIYTAGNIVFADGSVQSTAGGASYGNTQVAAYLTAGSFATTTDITAAIDDLMGFAPTALDTLGEIAANLANGADAVSSITSSIASTNANVIAANAAIATLQSQVYSNTNVAAYLTGSITTGNILPGANVTYNLGSATQQWNSLYVSSNTIYLGGVPLSVSSNNLLVNGSALAADTGAVTFERNKIKGGGVDQVGHRFSIATNKDGQTSVNSNGINLAYSTNANLIASGWTVQFANGGSSTISFSTTNSGYVSMQMSSAVAYTFPLTFISPDYVVGEEALIELTPDEAIPSSTWSFYGNGNVRFPDGTTQTTAYTGASSSYGNADVIAALQNLTTNVTTTANVTAANIVTTGATSGNISGANYISANVFQVSTGIFWANGTAWSSTGGGTNYTNANVSAFLAAMGSNSISTTGNITAANVSITNTYTVANIQTTGTYGNITGANVISANSVSVTTYVRTQPVTFAALPTAAAAGAGARAFITDGNTATFGSQVSGSGANAVPVFSNGTNWYVG